MSDAITALMSAAARHAIDMKAAEQKTDSLKRTLSVDDEQVTVLVQVWRLKKPTKRDRTGIARKRV